MNEKQSQERLDALDRLQAGQVMLAEGRKALSAAHDKITEGQRLIDESADILRNTWRDRRPGETS